MQFPRRGFVILVDGLRHDYVTPEVMPFLAELKGRSASATVVETVAFQTRPAYFAGLEPEASDICHLYAYDPQRSPFRQLRPFTGLLRVLDSLGRFGLLRRVITRIGRAAARRAGFPAMADVLSTENVPLALLPLFTLSEERYTDDAGALPAPTFFDALRAKGMDWSWIGYPRHTGDTPSILQAYSAAPDSDIAYLHFSELDWLGHRFGPDSSEMEEGRRAIDETLKQLLSPAIEKSLPVVVFGDHGMVQVEYVVNALEVLKSLPLRLGRDYLVFLDSTQARFWYLDSSVKPLIEAALTHLRGGHFISDEERGELGLRFPNRRFGDAIFVLDGPGIIHPSFFSGGIAPFGMHGYPPNVLDNQTQVIASAPTISAGKRGTIRMTEIFSILKEAFELRE